MTKVQQMLSTDIRVHLLPLQSHIDTSAVSASPSCQTHSRLSAYLLAAVLLPDCPVQLASLVLALQLDRPLIPFLLLRCVLYPTERVQFSCHGIVLRSMVNQVGMALSFSPSGHSAARHVSLADSPSSHRAYGTCVCLQNLFNTSADHSI